ASRWQPERRLRAPTARLDRSRYFLANTGGLAAPIDGGVCQPAAPHPSAEDGAGKQAAGLGDDGKKRRAAQGGPSSVGGGNDQPTLRPIYSLTPWRLSSRRRCLSPFFSACFKRCAASWGVVTVCWLIATMTSPGCTP